MKSLMITLGLLLALGTVQAETVKLVTSGGFSPFTDQNWKNQGMVTEIVRQVMRVADREVSIEFQPTWGNLMTDTEAGKYDGTFPWYYNEERAERFYITEPLAATYVLPYVRKGSNIHASNPGDLAGYRMCRPAGYYTHDLVELLERPDTTLTFADNLVACFEMLKNNEVDVVPVDLFSAMAAINTVFDSTSDVRRLSIVISRQSMHILVPKNHPNGQELVQTINKALFKLETRGILQSIRDNHASIFLRQFN